MCSLDAGHSVFSQNISKSYGLSFSHIRIDVLHVLKRFQDVPGICRSKNMSTETELNLKQRWCHRGPTARGLAPHLRNSCYEDAAWKAVVQSQGRLEVPKAGKDGIAFWCLDVCVCRCNVSNIFFCISLFSIFIYILYNPMTMLCFTPLFFDRCKVSIHLTGLKRIQRFAVAI